MTGLDCQPDLCTHVKATQDYRILGAKERNHISGEKSGREYCMKAVVAFLLVGCATVSTFASGERLVPGDASPPQIKVAINNLPEPLRTALAVPPTLPLGPADLLHGYEDDMRAVSARFVNELAVLSKAFTERQMTRDQAEQLSEERYLVAMMQFELLSALHAQLEQEIDRETMPQKSRDSMGENPTGVVELPFSSFQPNHARSRQLELNSAQIRAINRFWQMTGTNKIR